MMPEKAQTECGLCAAMATWPQWIVIGKQIERLVDPVCDRKPHLTPLLRGCMCTPRSAHLSVACDIAVTWPHRDFSFASPDVLLLQKQGLRTNCQVGQHICTRTILTIRGRHAVGTCWHVTQKRQTSWQHTCSAIQPQCWSSG